MIGFIASPAIATAILIGIKSAQESRGLPHYWTVGSYPIFTGEHAGKMFLATNLRGGLTPVDFPEFGQLVGALGGLEARIDLAPSVIIDPNAQTGL